MPAKKSAPKKSAPAKSPAAAKPAGKKAAPKPAAKAAVAPKAPAKAAPKAAPKVAPKAPVAKPVASKAAVKAAKIPAAKVAAPSKAVAKPSSTPQVSVDVVFERFSPESSSVDLVGTFNDWQVGRHPMKRDAKGTWKAKLRLAPGSYEYQFVYDGQHYEPDPERQQVSNAFGSSNNLLIVA